MGRRKEREAIEEVIETLYAIDLQGYHLDAKVLKSAAIERIHRTLERLNKEKRRTIEDDTNYRLERFKKFSTLTENQREEVIQVAKERHISIEEAYALSSKG